MKRQTIAALTLGSFIVFSFSCYSLKPIKPEALVSPDAGELEIRRLDKTSGETIEFPRLRPGRIDGNNVVGKGTLAKTVELVKISKDSVLEVSQIPTPQGETSYLVETRDGKFYKGVKKIDEQEDKSVLYVIKDVYKKTKSIFKVSLADVERVWIDEVDLMKTLNKTGLRIFQSIVMIPVMIAAILIWGIVLLNH